MELKFRPKFKRDLQKLKGKKELNERIYGILIQIKSATNLSQIPSHKTLNKYKTRYRIKIKINLSENYRMGFILKGETIWAERILSREDFYMFYKR